MRREELLKTAETAARKAGRIISRRRNGDFRVDHKGAVDLVTEVDLASEKAILEVIRSKFPDHRIVAEEKGAGEENSDYTWWIDPLDGTTNFVHGYPCYSVSIAVSRRLNMLAGVVYDPVGGEMFSAVRGRGAFLNGRPISVSRVEDPEESLLATGFPYDRTRRPLALSLAGRMLEIVHGLRRAGSAALDLAYVAAGRLDGFWEFGLKPWDTAAGTLLVEEAGGVVSDFKGEKFDINRGGVVAGNRFIHPVIVRGAVEIGRKIEPNR